MRALKAKVGLGLLASALAVSLAACGGGATPAPAATATSAGNAANGETLYLGTCSACHGPDATGVTGLGKNLRTSTFVAEQTDEALLKFIQTGRPASDPLNTTGVDMPPRGGNPALTDANLADIIAYLRSIHQGS
ncbi:MAG: cytochrome c [Anaerolineales bacterium]|nr:cytochrome c [Anaerolineales bacterium]